LRFMVFSDSHGYSERMLSAIGQSTPDMIIHLGDGGRDIDKIKKKFPKIPLKAVRGNCDFGSDLPETELFSVGAVNIFITHGHTFGVKRVLAPLIDEAMALGANMVMFGHTHIPVFSMAGGLYVLNPGACGGFAPSCAEVIIDEKGEISCRILMI